MRPKTQEKGTRVAGSRIDTDGRAKFRGIARPRPAIPTPSGYPFGLSCFRLILALELDLTLALNLKIEFIAKYI